MKKQIFICSLFLFGMACSNYEDLTTPEQSLRIENETTEQTIALENVVFDEATGQWLYLAGDPYKLENVKQAYNRIISGESRFKTTRSQIDELIEIGEPEITHYSLKFYPRTEAEQWRIMRIDGLQYSFYPFEYMPLTDEQVQTLSLTRSSTQTLPFESRYSVTYSNLETSEGPIESRTIHLPTIYATWPVENSLPLDLEFEIVEELYLPEYTGSESDSSVALLESEIIPITPPWEDDPIIPFPPVINSPKFKGRVLHYDSKLEQEVPIAGMSIVMRYGSNSVSATTDENGYFEIYDAITSIASTSIYLSSDYYWITIVSADSSNENTVTYTEPIGLANDFKFDFLSNQAITSVTLNNDDYPYFETAVASNFYFNGDHELLQAIEEDGLRIAIMEYYYGADSGQFIPTSDNHSYIAIYNITYIVNDNYAHMMGTIFHELGHYAHFHEKNGIRNDMINIDLFIAESYASYAGDYLTRLYYSNYDLTFSPTYLFESRQDWHGITSLADDYTPLFVDLFDTYNQSQSTMFNYPNDNLSGFSHEAMHQIAQDIDTWDELKAALRSYIGIYYTAEDINNYIAYYDSWIEHKNIIQ